MAFSQVILSIFYITGQLRETSHPALFFCSNGRGLGSLSATHAVAEEGFRRFFEKQVIFILYGLVVKSKFNLLTFLNYDSIRNKRKDN